MKPSWSAWCRATRSGASATRGRSRARPSSSSRMLRATSTARCWWSTAAAPARVDRFSPPKLGEVPGKAGGGGEEESLPRKVGGVPGEAGGGGEEESLPRKVGGVPGGAGGGGCGILLSSRVRRVYTQR